MRRIALLVLLAGLLSSCSPSPSSRAGLPASLWADRPEGAGWTKAALFALDSHGAPLVSSVPADVSKYCPGYAEAGAAERKAFWVTFLSALAGQESTWRPDAAGGGGRWLGLLQISPETAEGYGCRVQNGADLKNGALNLSCGIRIMAVTVPRDGVISEGMQGVAADWGPFRDPAKLNAIRNATRTQPYCAG